MKPVLDARTANDHFPGIGRYVVNLARALAPHLPELTVLGPPADHAHRLALPSLPGAPCPISPFALQQQWVIPARLRALGATLYHSPYYLMPYLPGVPTVLTAYDVIPLVIPQDYTASQRLAFRLTHQLALQTASVILAISAATRADLLRHFHVAPAKIRVTPLAADPGLRPPTPEQSAALRQRIPLPVEYCLYVGSNKPHKNLLRLVEAFGRLPAPTPPLVVAGAWDPRYPEAQRLVEARGWQTRVQFLGPVREVDLPALYGNAALFIFPSLYEGFGLPVLEAMACGAPVICSRAASLPEVAGQAALLFDPLDVDGLAQLIENTLADRARRAALQAASLARAAQFTWEQTARLTLAAYQEASG